MMEPLNDHARLCEGREYTCTCGYDDQQASRLSDAEARIAELEAGIKRLSDEEELCGETMPDEDAFNLARMAAKLAEAEARAEAAEALLKEAKTALEPFAKVVQHDISTGEDDRDVFRPMPGQYARAERITVGHLRAARAIHDKIGVKDE